ncbi:hypothetical protein EV586_10160 [Tumebacillus sp. BK434]|nr:hypothetical protein EV586_10160 [Tumebacillus sp. BK434]
MIEVKLKSFSSSSMQRGWVYRLARRAEESKENEPC